MNDLADFRTRMRENIDPKFIHLTIHYSQRTDTPDTLNPARPRYVVDNKRKEAYWIPTWLEPFIKQHRISWNTHDGETALKKYFRKNKITVHNDNPLPEDLGFDAADTHISFHIYIHYKQKDKDTLDYPNDVNFSHEEVKEIVKKYENGDDFLLGGFTIHSDPVHIKNFEIWETPSELAHPVDWNNMWRIAKLVTKKFTASIPGGRRVNVTPKKEKEDKRESAQAKENYREWDLFICHASEDKEEVVRPLVNALIAVGFSVWYDEFTLTLGDSLRRSIDKGLAQSRYGLVILSQNFFKKNWPQTELDGLAARERDRKKVILPVWHKINREYVLKFSPTLADRVAVLTEEGINKVVKEVSRAVKRARNCTNVEQKHEKLY